MRSRPIDLAPLLQRALNAVERLAIQRGVAIVMTTTPAEPVQISADPSLVQQLFTHLLSQIIQQTAPGEISLALLRRSEGATIRIRYAPQTIRPDSPATSAVVQQLVERLGWHTNQEALPDGQCLIVLEASSSGPSVLIVDDNQGLVELLQRYLTGQTCRVWAATSGSQGFEMASQLIPDGIILDVMMPDVDGWDCSSGCARILPRRASPW